MTRKNPVSSIRRGFEYQDIWDLYLCADWLKNPRKFKWIWFETVPNEVQDRDFHLDDILLCDAEDSYLLYQIKYKQDPSAGKWSWDDFLKQEKSKKGGLLLSLIQKWFKSYFKPALEGRIRTASFVTNGLAKDEISDFFNASFVQILGKTSRK
ncbi:hypothetical protein HKBW3C_02745 [Candidatus Hakubella thermalkaliphila]|nr:hypothetical protein HKBW3C_02745 [Candidatus Hakubella thermalkaliphila]